jgi:hypothetical protein
MPCGNGTVTVHARQVDKNGSKDVALMYGENNVRYYGVRPSVATRQLGFANVRVCQLCGFANVLML